MIINKFEDIVVWDKAKKLTVIIYRVFQKNKDYGFKDQIQRASISIMNNIAEGFGRKNRKEFIRYLIISDGSCEEVKSMIYISKELNYISEEDFNIIYNSIIEISKMLNSFMRYLKSTC